MYYDEMTGGKKARRTKGKKSESIQLYSLVVVCNNEKKNEWGLRDSNLEF